MVACWAYYSDKHISQDGKPLEINDVLADNHHKAAKENEVNALSFLKLDEVFGELAKNEVFTGCYQSHLERIYQNEPVLLFSEELAKSKLAMAKAS